MNPAFVETQQRWDAFRAKIESRFHELLSQAESLLPNVLEFQEFDTAPFSVAWQGIEGQAKDLVNKIQETWQEKVSPAFEAAKETEEQAIEAAEGSLDEFYPRFYALYYAEQAKGLSLAHQLEKELRGYQTRTFAEAARKLQGKAAEVLSKTFLCTQCKAPLPVRPDFFRSYYQTCGYCQTVNTFEPGTLARNVEHFAVHALAEEKAAAEREDYCDLENRFKGQRDDQPKVITGEQVIQAYQTYAEKYLKARIAIIPDYEKEYEKDLAGKVGHVRTWVLGMGG